MRCARLWRPPAADGLGPRAQAIADHLRAAGRVVLRRDPRGGRRRLPARHRRRAVGSGLARPRHQRRAAGAARLRRRRSDRSCRAARVPRVRATGRVFRSRRQVPPSAEGRWSLLSARVDAGRRRPSGATALAQQLLTRYGVVTREVGAAEGDPGRLLRRLRRAARARRERPRPARVLRRRRRRDAVRAAAGARPAAVAARSRPRSPRPSSSAPRSGQPVRHAVEVAVARDGRPAPAATTPPTRRCAAARRGPSARASCSSTAPASRTSRAAAAKS